MHCRKRHSLERRTRGVELGQFAGLALEQPERGRRSDRVDRDGPLGVVPGGGGDVYVTLQSAFEEGDVATGFAVERLPFGAEVIYAVGNHLAGARIGDDVADVGALVFADHRALAGCDVLRDQRRGFPVPAVDPVKGLAVRGVAGRRGRKRIVEPDLFKRRRGDLVVDHAIIVASSVRARFGCRPKNQLLVGEEARIVARIDQHRRELAGCKVEAVDVMPLGIAVIDPQQDAIGNQRRYLDDLHAGLGERGQRPGRSRRRVDPVEQEILVSAGIVDEQQLARIGRPEILADRALGFGGQRLCGGHVADRRNPQVHHAIARCDERELPAIGRDLAAGANRVAEQIGAGDQRNLGQVGRCGRGCLRRRGRGQRSDQHERSRCGEKAYERTRHMISPCCIARSDPDRKASQGPVDEASVVFSQRLGRPENPFGTIDCERFRVLAS